MYLALEALDALLLSPAMQQISGLVNQAYIIGK